MWVMRYVDDGGEEWEVGWLPGDALVSFNAVFVYARKEAAALRVHYMNGGELNEHEWVTIRYSEVE